MSAKQVPDESTAKPATTEPGPTPAIDPALCSAIRAAFMYENIGFDAIRERFGVDDETIKRCLFSNNRICDMSLELQADAIERAR